MSTVKVKIRISHSDAITLEDAKSKKFGTIIALIDATSLPPKWFAQSEL
jgi:hypothetical protein